MSNTVLQVPMDKDLRNQATAVVQDLGFSSLQEPVRVFLRQLAKRRITVSFGPMPIKLSEKAIKRYDRMTDDFEAGRNVFTANSVDELMRQLHEN